MANKKQETSPNTLKGILDLPDNESGTTMEGDDKIQFLDSVMGHIFSTKKIEIRANLTSEQTLPISVGLIVANAFENDFLLTSIETILKTTLSKGGRSRNDMVTIAKGIQGEGGGMLEQEALSDKILGRRRR